MTTKRLPDSPSFSEWYRAVNHREPFPWQERLANQLADGQAWPSLVGIPTGLGKTACIDIAIWALAHQADRRPIERTAPTRLWWVVNRRLLVDDTYRHAERVAQLLADADDDEGPVGAVASRLRRIAGNSGTDGVPLEVIKLRGGGRREIRRATARRNWRPSTPAQPAVICSTIPMFGSRILFRGYGSSRYMRPIDAALAYTDSLVIIDEAHLAAHLQTLLHDLATLDSAEVHPLPQERRSPVVVALTATGDPDIRTFRLADDDYEHGKIRQRIHADKPILIKILERATTPSKVTAGLVSEVTDLLKRCDPGVTLVFVNSPITARMVAKRLRSVRSTDVVVATGQIRGFEATRVTEEIVDQAGCGVDRADRDRHLVIVSTQTLEVGADIDADYLVTEACGVRALIQRLGRLNRLGERPHAEGVYVHTPGKKGSWPVYGEEPSTVLTRLQHHANNKDVVDLPPEKVTMILGDPQDRPDPAPVIATAILWEWMKTTTPPPGEAPVNPYFAGFEDRQRHVNVAWRLYLPSLGERLWPTLEHDETVEVLLSDAVSALNRLDDEQWTMLDSRSCATAVGSSEDLNPGNTILIRTDAGLLDQDGHWDARASNPIQDVSILRSGLPVVPGALSRLYEGTPPDGARQTVDAILEAHDQEDTDKVKEKCYSLLRKLSSAPTVNQADEWRGFIANLKTGLDDRMKIEHPALIAPRDEVSRLPLPPERPLPMRTVALDADDGLSIRSKPVSLARHGEDTANEAFRILVATGISEALSETIVTAARLHDVGKSDPRFQRSLSPEWADGDTPNAKSGLPRYLWARHRVAAGWPQGGRHEELSRRLVKEWLTSTEHDTEDPVSELIQHLVVAHHGRGRPFLVPVDDTTSGVSLVHTISGASVSIITNLALPDWEQPNRFAILNKRYGPWGLALLEAIVRQSDHVASSTPPTREVE